MGDPFCEEVSRTTNRGCEQPERWLLEWPDGLPALPREQARVCQSHARVLVRQGWTPVRELHPVAGYERTAP